jgi:hypothetical protein
MKPVSLESLTKQPERRNFFCCIDQGWERTENAGYLFGSHHNQVSDRDFAGFATKKYIFTTL